MQQEIIPHLFRTEYSKIIAVLCNRFGIEHVEAAEDIVSDTFLTATELWGLKGVPQNPAAWLYTVAKNKTKNYLKRNSVFAGKIAKDLIALQKDVQYEEIDLSNESIADSQLAMIFVVCHPGISSEAQIALALNLLCGFGVNEIADAFLTNKEVIYKRLKRAKEKLKEVNLNITAPVISNNDARLSSVLLTLYLLFNEGYYSVSGDHTIRKEFCMEAMRLNLIIIDNDKTNTPSANALMALMCFHASRLRARAGDDGEMILYDKQDTDLWDTALIEKGISYLNAAAKGNTFSKFHLEAAIAYWHTHKEDTEEKWESVLQLYNQLLLLEYSPIAALNRTYALSKANGVHEAIKEAEKLQLADNHFYFILLGTLYTGIDNVKALGHFNKAYSLAKSENDRAFINEKIKELEDMF